MAAISPPSTIIKYIESIISNFFWGRDQDKKKYHWASMDRLSLPYNEGGVGIGRIKDVSTALQYKQWWMFRSNSSIWSQFLKSKYCKRANPVAKKFDNGNSLIWKYMLNNRHKVEKHISWQIRSGNCSFW